MNKIKVMIVDQQILFKVGIKHVLSEEADFDLLDGEPDKEIINRIESEYPDVILVDTDYSTIEVIELTKKIIQTFPNIRVIALNSNLNDGLLIELVKIGVAAFLGKNSSPNDLINSIREACNGKYPINDLVLAKPAVAEQVLEQFKKLAATPNMASIAAPITKRETEVLSYIANGNSNKQIASVFGISEQTIKNHVSSIMRKLNANDRAHAAVMAVRRGYISPAETE